MAGSDGLMSWCTAFKNARTLRIEDRVSRYSLSVVTKRVGLSNSVNAFSIELTTMSAATKVEITDPFPVLFKHSYPFSIPTS